jgi:hypothetical protein
VVVFEREKFPRSHIGESLLLFSMKAFTRPALHEEFLRAGFQARGLERQATWIISMVAVACCLTGCATTSRHQFAQPGSGWQTRAGQLMYRTPKATLIGEAVVRFSKIGDFDLTVSKGPGFTLLSLRQDAQFAEFNATFSGQRWSGPITQAPPQLRGWLELRDQFLRAPDRRIVRYTVGDETFVFRF